MIWRTIERPGDSVWLHGCIPSHFSEGPVKAPSIWWESFTWNRIVRGENLERRYFGRRHWGAGKFWLVRKPCSKTQCKGSDDAKKSFFKCSRSQVAQTNCLEEMMESENPLNLEEAKNSTQWRASRKFGQVSTTRRKKMTLKPVTIFGRSKEIAFIVIVSNLEFSSTCRRKNHSQYHCDTLTWSGLHRQTWTCCKKAEWTIIGTLKWIEIDRNQVSRSSQNWKRNTPKDFCGPGAASKNSKMTRKLGHCGNVDADRSLSGSWTGFTFTQLTEQLADLISCGQRFRPACQKAAQGRAALGRRETEGRQCAKVERHPFYWSGWWIVQGNH